MKVLIRFLKGIKFRGLKYYKADVLFVTHDNYQVSVEGQKYDRVLEYYKLDIIKQGKAFFELNLATGNIKFVGINEENTVSIQSSLFFIKVYCYLITRLISKHANLEIQINYINSQLSKVFPGFELTLLEIRQYLIYLDLLKNYFAKLFGKLGISSIYQANYYSSLELAINAAANQLEVKTYCVQHGGQSRNNPAFGQWTNVPLNGYALLPDIFLCWDEESANTITEWSSETEHHKAQVNGYQWPELWREGRIKYNGFPVLRKLSSGKLNILYTMQPSIGMPPEMIIEMIKKSSNLINWWLRLHPRQVGTKVDIDLKKMYSNKNNIFLLEASSEPLPALMINMDLHLTSFSSCVYEAMLFNVPTLFINRMGHDYFIETIQSGQAKLCLTYKELEVNIYEKLYDKFNKSNDISHI